MHFCIEDLNFKKCEKMDAKTCCNTIADCARRETSDVKFVKS